MCSTFGTKILRAYKNQTKDVCHEDIIMTNVSCNELLRPSLSLELLLINLFII